MLLSEIELQISDSQGVELKEPNTGIFFDWGPDQQNYYAHIDRRVENTELEELMRESLLKMKDR